MDARTPEIDRDSADKAPLWDRITPSLLFMLQGSGNQAPADLAVVEAEAFHSSHDAIAQALHARHEAVLVRALAQCDAAASAIAQIAADARTYVGIVSKQLSELSHARD